MTETYDDIDELGKSYINFDFETYFKLLDKFSEEYKIDPFISKFLHSLIDTSKKGVMITYITPYKN